LQSPETKYGFTAEASPSGTERSTGLRLKRLAVEPHAFHFGERSIVDGVEAKVSGPVLFR
jgi:hypothetical protein